MPLWKELYDLRSFNLILGNAIVLCDLCVELVKPEESGFASPDSRRMERSGAVIRLLGLTGVPMSCADCGAAWIRWCCLQDTHQETWEHKARLGPTS